MKNLILISFLFSILFSANAQAPKAFLNSKLELSINNEVYKRGFWSQAFPNGEYFKDNPVAQEHYDAHISNARWASGSLWGGLGLAITYLTTTSDPSMRTYWSIFGLGFIAHCILMGNSQTNLMKAINIYNGVKPELATNQKFKWAPTFSLGDNEDIKPGLAFQLNF